jgi:hypothetical protein
MAFIPQLLDSTLNQNTPIHRLSDFMISILSFGLYTPTNLYYSGFQTKILYAILNFLNQLNSSAHSILVDLIKVTVIVASGSKTSRNL